MSAFYQCIGFATFWSGVVYIIRAVAIFFIEEHKWPMSVLGWLNRWIFQWFFFRIVWQQYKMGGNMIALGLIFVVPLSGYNGRQYRPNNPKPRMFWRKSSFRPTKKATMSVLSSSERPISQEYQLAYNEQGKVVTDIDSYAQSLRLILLTEPGSDVMRPDFGVGITSMIGQPLGRVRGEIKRRLSQQLAAYLPEVTVTAMVITGADKSGHLTVRVDWTVSGKPSRTTVIITTA